MPKISLHLKTTGHLKAAGLASLIALALPLHAYAAGSDSTEPPEKTKTTTTCVDGQVWDEDTKECVDPDEARLDDETLYRAARELAYDGQYDNALRVLASMKEQNQPRVLNYKGYANRKAGRFDVGMRYYRQALDIDPDFILARSYMGQALAEDGQLVLAHAELKEIRNRGGRETLAYKALERTLFEGSGYN